MNIRCVTVMLVVARVLHNISVACILFAHRKQGQNYADKTWKLKLQQNNMTNQWW